MAMQAQQMELAKPLFKNIDGMGVRSFEGFS